jgi:hypothetical protein
MLTFHLSKGIIIMSGQVRRFRIVAGKHHAGHGISYKAGDVLESTRRLDEIFRNKFIEVSDITPVTAPPDPDGVPPLRPASLTLATGAAVILEKRLAEANKTIDAQRDTIALMKLGLETGEQKLATTEAELVEANKKIEALEKAVVASTKDTKPAGKKAANKAVGDEDPFKD